MLRLFGRRRAASGSPADAQSDASSGPSPETMRIAELAIAQARLTEANAERVRAGTAAASRLAHAMIEGMSGPVALGDYDASRRSRLERGGSLRGGAADYHLDPSTLEALQRRCSSAQRNNKVAQGLVNRLASLVVQDGFLFEATTSSAEYNRKADKLLSRWESEPIDLAGLSSPADIYQQLVGAACYRGAALVNIQDDASVQIIERERLVNPDRGPNRPEMINGVELKGGRIVRFHVADWADYLSNTLPTTRTIPADGAMYMRNPLGVAEGQITGEPALQGVIRAIEDLDQWVLSTDIAARVATLFGIVVQTPNPSAMQGLLEAGTDQSPDHQTGKPKLAELQPGQAWFAPEGTTVQQIDPKHPAQNFGDVVNTRLMLIGLPLGMPLVLTSLDFRQVNFSAARSATAVAFLEFMRWQHWLRRLDRRLRAQRLAWHIRRGDLPFVDDWDSFQTYLPPAPVYDFDTETKSTLAAVQGGMMTYRQAMQRLGTGNWDEVFAQLGIERQRQIDLGIVPADLPGATRPGASVPGDNTPAASANPATGQQ